MPPLSNPRHEEFAQGLAAGKWPTAAYVEAGYKPSPASATRLSKSVKVAGRVSELIGRGAERAEIDVARILRELARLGLSDVRRLVDERGQLRPLHELDDDTAAAVASVEIVSKPGEDGSSAVTLHKVRLWDKNTALDKLAKHLGLLTERHDVTVRRSVEELTEDELVAIARGRRD